MRSWTLVLVWLANVLAISSTLAIFEIVLERDEGWASALNPASWGKKLFERSHIANLCEKQYITPYHIFVFVVVLPTIFLFEYVLLRWLGHDGQSPSGVLGASKSGLAMTIGGMRLNPFLYFAAVWFFTFVVEDFLWFALNWYYPRSLTDLLSGNIWWHTRWVTIGTIKLPRFYVIAPLLSFVFLLASDYFAG